MSEYKLEDAETVALSDATKIIGLDTNGVPCWIDPASLAQGGFKAWLENHSDIVNYWWPDKSDVGLLAKSGRRCTDFNSYSGVLTDKEGVRVYSAAFRNDEYLKFNGTQTDQISMSCSEFGVFYFDPSAAEPAYGSEMRFFANNTASNSGGFRIYRASNVAGDYSFFAHASINQTVKSLTGALTGIVAGWNFFHNTVTVDSELLTAEFKCSVNGVVIGSLIESIPYDRASAVINNGEVAVYAVDNFYPAFYAKSRVTLTDLEAAEIFTRFKSEYGIA